jgi:hypothetical protein
MHSFVLNQNKNIKGKYTSMLHVATKETQTESFSVETQRKICGMTMKEVIDCCSSFLLPCMLGIFTVVITLYQANLSTKQRLDDQLAAREQREQDFNVKAPDTLEDPSWTNDAKDSLEDPSLKTNFFL